MEQFLTSFGQHATSFFNLKAMAWINTGDRMMDTTIQMMVSTVTAALVGGLLALYKNRGLLTDIKQSFRSFFKKGSYNPLIFDPSLTDRKPLNGKTFLYSVDLTSEFRKAFSFWFLKNHSDKIFRLENLEKSMNIVSYDKTLPTLLESNDLVQSQFYKYCNVPFSLVTKKGECLPIWKDKNGLWVYYSTEDHCNATYGYLFSDSLKAVENCFKSIKDYCDILKEAEEPVEKGQQLIMELENKEGNVHISTGKIPLNKTFDTLFFEQKEAILPVLKAFKEKTLFPAHLPVDTKLGILLHGPPGTGKTGFISALANFLERKVLVVDMSKVTTRTVLDRVLTQSNDNDYIYVFEEFDTMPGIQKRKKKVERDEMELLAAAAAGPVKSPEMMMMAMASSKDTAMMEEYKKEMEAAKDKIDLGYLLRKLDGLQTANNRIIVASTNHPEKIDPALLRPGRFGIQVKLGYATKKMVQEIVGMIYKEEISEEDAKGVPSEKWSPAEILQHGMLYSNPKKLLEVLRTAEPERE